jgi:Ca-activated chloride channel family protein
MTGRHSASRWGAKASPGGTDQSARRYGRQWPLGLLILLAPAAVFGTIRVQSVIGSEDTCAGQETIKVTAAPNVAPALQKVGATWADQARPDDVCPTVEVTSRSSVDAEAELASPGVTTPDVWIPDSSLWIQRLRRDVSGRNTPAQSAWVSPSIASSPIVLAASPADASSLVKVAAGGWSEVLSGKTQFAIVDPEKSTDGLQTLATAQVTLGKNSGRPTRELVSSLVGLSSSVLSSTSEGIKAMSTTSLPFPTNEQAVIEANSGAGPPEVQSIYPRGRSMSLDFPVMQFAPPTQAPAHRDAVESFVSFLDQSTAQRELRAIGLRNADGQSFPTTVDFEGIAPTAVIQSLPPASDHQVIDAIRVWSAVQRGNRTLIVVDVSGSMAESGGEKIRFAAAAAENAVGYLPDTAELGLWAFSTDLTGSAPWRELVSLGALGSPNDKDARRQELRTQTARLPSLTESRGNTGLYRTTWAAFQLVHHGYDPDRYNSVVLVTDGANTAGGLNLEDLLRKLEAARETSRPLPIFTIAVGSDADVKTLKRISGATGGSEYTVAAASDIRSIFLDAVIKAGS